MRASTSDDANYHLNQVHCFLAFSRASLWLRTPPNVCALAESVSNGRKKNDWS